MVNRIASTDGAARGGPGLEHGGSLAEARALFPDAPEPRIDLSTGINPHAYPLETVPPEAWTRLPEPADIAALERTAAKAYGLADPALCIAAPGTQPLIGLLPRLVAGGRVAVLGPTYGEHAAAWAHAGYEVTEVADIDALAGADVAILCNPNNPDGRRFPPDQLLALQTMRRGRLLVVDEAFADLEDGPLGLAPYLPVPGLVVLRSFGKTYGLAGLRLGFALAGPELSGQLRAVLGPWAVSGPAALIGRTALADEAWRVAMKSRLDADAARLDAAIVASGLAVAGGTRLFRFVEGKAAPDVFARLGGSGIHVRRFVGRPECLRMGLPASHHWTRLHLAMFWLLE